MVFGCDRREGSWVEREVTEKVRTHLLVVNGKRVGGARLFGDGGSRVAVWSGERGRVR